MQKNLQPYDRSEQSQAHFITDLGALLAKQSANSQPLYQRQAVANLAEYVRVARSHHNLTRSALARQINKSEAEIYALEQGFLPYAQIDLPLLCKVAAALGEEVETLVLLLGQPALANSLRNKSTHKHGDTQRFTWWFTWHRRTISKQVDNWVGTLLGVNLRFDPFRNLIHSWQEGRLVPCIQETYRLTVNLPVKMHIGLRTSAVLLVCLLLFGVSTYSLSTFFDAQSSEELYTTLPYQNHARAERSSNLLTITSTASITTMEIMAAQRRSRQNAISPVDPVNEQPTANIALLLLPPPNESERCDGRINGRFTICRV